MIHLLKGRIAPRKQAGIWRDSEKDLYLVYWVHKMLEIDANFFLTTH